ALSSLSRIDLGGRLRCRSGSLAACCGCLPARPAPHGRSLRRLSVTAMNKAPIERSHFGRMGDGSVVERVVLRGAEGFEAGIISYGAVLHTLFVRDRDGRSDDIVLGHDGFDDYLAQRKFLGATIGRYANRIAGARFMLDGTAIQLDANNDPNMLHGGNDGFDRKLWRIVEVREAPEPAGGRGFPHAGGAGG